MCSTEFLVPGVVRAWSSPVTGILDIGRFPSGTDEVTNRIVSILRTSTFRSEPRGDIMRWKYGKLLVNLGNAVDALRGPSALSNPITDGARQRGSPVSALPASTMSERKKLRNGEEICFKWAALRDNEDPADLRGKV